MGAGNRGTIYGNFALRRPGRLRFTAVAEPIETRLRKFSTTHRIPPERRFSHWEQLLQREKMADAAFICTQDRMHTRAAIRALHRGYHVLLEKPMAHALKDCVRIAAAARSSGRSMAVCHVLRYTDF
jgi:predicted dehydrogenase